MSDLKFNLFLNKFSIKNLKALLRIPFFTFKNNTIVKLEIEYDQDPSGTSFHIGNSPTNDLNGN